MNPLVNAPDYVNILDRKPKEPLMRRELERTFQDMGFWSQFRLMHLDIFHDTNYVSYRDIDYFVIPFTPFHIVNSLGDFDRIKPLFHTFCFSPFKTTGDLTRCFDIYTGSECFATFYQIQHYDEKL